MRQLPHAARLGIVARLMTDADLPFVAALYASTRAEELALSGWTEQQRHAFLDQQHRAQHHHYQTYYSGLEWLILEYGGLAIGRLYLAEWTREFRIVDISLDENHRNRGFGRAILEDVMVIAAACGKCVSIHVEKVNPARRLYDRLGFVPIEDKGIYDLFEWSPPAIGTQKKIAS